MKDFTSKLEETEEAIFKRWYRHFKKRTQVFIETPESPLEALMLSVFIGAEAQGISVWKQLPLRSETKDRIDFCNPEFTVAPQVVLETGHRADFLARSWDWNKDEWRHFVIECDGHDFHHATKEQIERDKKRDREITAAGYRILRFSGSEIWRDPVACVDQVLEAAYAEG